MSKLASTTTTTRRFRRLPSVAAVLAILLVAASSAGAQELRSPDARATAAAITQPAAVDLRSPDAREASRALAQPATQDLRSPDARNGQFVSAPQHSAQSSGGSSNWGYLAVGVLLSLMIAASVLLVQRRRGRVLPLGS